MNPMVRFLFVLATVASTSCSGTSSTGTSGGGTDGGPNPTIPEGGSPLANGSCSFTLEGTAYDLPGYAMINGSGNMILDCATSAVALKLQIGDPTYDGPGEYTFAPNKIDGGNMTFTLSDHVYDATSGSNVATACIVDVSVAPPNNSNPPVGSAIQGTFHCTAVPRYPKQPNGVRALQSDGSADFTSGAFNLAIR
jgi:hypothetical protein